MIKHKFNISEFERISRSYFKVKEYNVNYNNNIICIDFYENDYNIESIRAKYYFSDGDNSINIYYEGIKNARNFWWKDGLKYDDLILDMVYNSR